MYYAMPAIPQHKTVMLRSQMYYARIKIDYAMELTSVLWPKAHVWLEHSTAVHGEFVKRKLARVDENHLTVSQTTLLACDVDIQKVPME